MSNQKATPRMELVRVVMTPLGSAASNVFNMLNMMFFLTFCTEALNLNVVVVGVVMTAMRLFDGITDPIIGNIIDRTETRFGKFRPFLVVVRFCGSCWAQALLSMLALLQSRRASAWCGSCCGTLCGSLATPA